MELILFWLIFAIVVGVIAANRGRSGVGWFLISVLLSPLLGLILVLALGTPADKRPAATANVSDELTKLAALRQSGDLTQDEYETQKARLLAGPPTKRAKGTCRNCGKPIGGGLRLTCQHCGTMT